MGELIDLARRRSKPALTPEERRFDDLVFEMGQFPLPTLIEALIASRNMHNLVGIVDQLTAHIIYSTSAPDTA